MLDAMDTEPRDDATVSDQPAVEDDGILRCEKCGAPGQDTKEGWCRRCGYYGRLNTYIEVDPWDSETEGETPPPAAESSPAAILRQVPSWVWTLTAGTAGIVVASFLALVVTPADSLVRSAWGLTQLGAGLLVFWFAHVWAYLFAIIDDSQLTLLDAFLRPFRIWKSTLADLPRGRFRLQMGTYGLTAAILAVAVVGGIPWGMLTNWQVKKRANVNLVHAVTNAATEQAAQNQGARDLESAIKDFATGAQEGADGAISEEEKEKLEQERIENLWPLQTDCLVLGYVPLGENAEDFSSLVIATTVDGRLKVVGKVDKGIPPDVRDELNRRFPKLKRKTPFIPCKSFSAVWLDPVLSCRVRHKSWNSSGQLVSPRFDSMLADLD